MSINRMFEPHMMAAFKASCAACELLDIMPDNDLNCELKNLMHIQFDLFCHVLEGKHYGSNNLSNFLDYVRDIEKQALRLKNAE